MQMNNGISINQKTKNNLQGLRKQRQKQERLRVIVTNGLVNFFFTEIWMVQMASHFICVTIGNIRKTYLAVNNLAVLLRYETLLVTIDKRLFAS